MIGADPDPSFTKVMSSKALTVDGYLNMDGVLRVGLYWHGALLKNIDRAEAEQLRDDLTRALEDAADAECDDRLTGDRE